MWSSVRYQVGRSSRLQAPGARGWAVLGAVLALVWLNADRASREARAEGARGHVLDNSSKSATVDWTLGLIMAQGEAAADIRAPSPGVARVKAEREARELAESRLSERARALVQDGADQMVARAMRHVVELDLRYASDGSVVARLGLPIESLRIARDGMAMAAPASASPSPKEDASAHPTVLVDARGVLDAPLLGPRLVAPSGAFSGPTVFHTSMDRALADERAGASLLVVRARAARSTDGSKDSTQSLDLDPDASATRIQRRPSGRTRAPAPEPGSLDLLAPSMKSGALVIIVIGKKAT